LARHPDGTAMTDAGIVKASELDPDFNKYPLTLADVKWLSSLTSWVEVQVSDMKAFVRACGVDFADRAQMRNANRYLNTDPKFSHLRRDKNFPAFREMLKTYYDSQING
jgi:hypothetical protein